MTETDKDREAARELLPYLLAAFSRRDDERVVGHIAEALAAARADGRRKERDAWQSAGWCGDD